MELSRQIFRLPPTDIQPALDRFEMRPCRRERELRPIAFQDFVIQPRFLFTRALAKTALHRMTKVQVQPNLLTNA